MHTYLFRKSLQLFVYPILYIRQMSSYRNIIMNSKGTIRLLLEPQKMFVKMVSSKHTFDQILFKWYDSRYHFCGKQVILSGLLDIFKFVRVETKYILLHRLFLKFLRQATSIPLFKRKIISFLQSNRLQSNLFHIIIGNMSFLFNNC